MRLGKVKGLRSEGKSAQDAEIMSGLTFFKNSEMGAVIRFRTEAVHINFKKMVTCRCSEDPAMEVQEAQTTLLIMGKVRS